MASCWSCSMLRACWTSRRVRPRHEWPREPLAREYQDMKSCLIVDDSKVVRKVARRILEDLHFAIEEAADGKLAMAACLRQMPDVILLDWNMPVMDGLEFLRTLRGTAGGAFFFVVSSTTENDL